MEIDKPDREKRKVNKAFCRVKLSQIKQQSSDKAWNREQL